LQSPIESAIEADHSDISIALSPVEKRALWRNRDFVLLWSGQVVSILGGQMAGLAYPLLVLALSHSPAKAGLVPIFWTAPFVLFGLPAGALVDRWNRKKVMIVCDAIRMLGVFSLPIAFFLRHLTVDMVYAAALAEGLGFCFFNIAEVSALPQVVSKQQLPQAMAMNEAGYAATGTVGPGLAGLLIGAMKTQIAGTSLVFIVDGISYLASLFGLASMRGQLQESRSDKPQRSIAAEVKEGLQFIWHQQRIRTVAFWSAWMALLYGPFQLAIIVMVHHFFHRGAGTIGLIFSAGGVGGIVGALMAPKIKQKFRFGQILLGIVFVQAVATLFLSVSPNLYFLAAMHFVLQMGNPMWNVTQMSYRMSVIPDKLLGRVNACYRLLIFAAFPLGAAVGGALLEHMNPRILIALMAAGAFAGVGMIATTKLRTA
jgi:MFS family permease